MKKNLLFLGLLAPAFVQAQTRTTIADGNATNPFTWDCTCVPLPGDNIVINHDLILDSDFAYSSGSVTVNASGTIDGTATNRFLGIAGGSFTNNGTVSIYNLLYSGGTFTNNGTLNVTNGFAVSGTTNVQNNNMLNVNDSLLIDSDATLTNPGTTYAKVTATDGNIFNTGTFTGDDLWNSGSVTSNTGPGMTLSNLYTNGSVNNGSELNISNDLWNSENMTNTNLIVIGNDMWNGDTIAGSAVFTNNGTISVTSDLNNSETLDGSGSYCIGSGSNNSGDVGGTLYICDQTGNDFDNNFGTIGSSVTFCTTGSCILGMNDNNNVTVNVYPNPVSGVLYIETGVSGLYELTVTNGVGQVVSRQSFTGNRASIDLSNRAAGMYVYHISGSGYNLTGKLVKE